MVLNITGIPSEKYWRCLQISKLRREKLFFFYEFSGQLLRLLPADKCGATVLMDKVDYQTKALDQLSDSTTYT